MEALAYRASTQVYLFGMALWVDKKSVAVLAALQILLNVINILVTDMTNFPMPVGRRKLIETGYQGWRHWLWRVGVFLTGATAVFGFIISMFARELLGVIYTPFYAQFAYLVPLLAVVYCFQTANGVLRMAFYTACMPQVGFAAQATSALTTVVIIYPLLTVWGIIGGVIGLLIT